MSATFEEKIEVVDQWKVESGDEFRLVNYGAGPDRLEIRGGRLFKPESSPYVHAILCQRIRDLLTLTASTEQGEK